MLRTGSQVAEKRLAFGPATKVPDEGSSGVVLFGKGAQLLPCCLPACGLLAEKLHKESGFLLLQRRGGRAATPFSWNFAARLAWGCLLGTLSCLEASRKNRKRNETKAAGGI